jgi:hypothetical protein
MTDTMRAILLNKDVIAIQQDPLGQAGGRRALLARRTLAGALDPAIRRHARAWQGWWIFLRAKQGSRRARSGLGPWPTVGQG